jgi:hypothetical protein
MPLLDAATRCSARQQCATTWADYGSQGLASVHITASPCHSVIPCTKLSCCVLHCTELTHRLMPRRAQTAYLRRPLQSYHSHGVYVMYMLPAPLLADRMRKYALYARQNRARYHESIEVGIRDAICTHTMLGWYGKRSRGCRCVPRASVSPAAQRHLPPPAGSPVRRHVHHTSVVVSTSPSD